MTWPLYILAGGQSVRFGLEDKARARLGEQPLVSHVAAALGPHATSVTVVGRVAGQFEDLGLRTIADASPDLGPMGGLHAALRDTDAAHILIAGCDMAHPQGTWLDLLAAQKHDLLAAAYRDHDRWHPMFARYSRALLPEIEARLARGERAMWRMLDGVGARAIPLPPQWSSMYSVNTPDDLRALEDARS